MTLCPNCGRSLPIERDGWRIYPEGLIEYNGELHRVRRSWGIILHYLCTKHHLVPTSALLNRASKSDNVNAIASTVSQLRQWLRDQGLPVPIKGVNWQESEYGFGGYMWCG